MRSFDFGGGGGEVIRFRRGWGEVFRFRKGGGVRSKKRFDHMIMKSKINAGYPISYNILLVHVNKNY